MQEMASPVGRRIERLDLSRVIEETDPQGRRFSKRTTWRGDRLVSVLRSVDDPPLRSEVVTERWIDGNGQLIQVCAA
jgi:hypothetical protein